MTFEPVELVMFAQTCDVTFRTRNFQAHFFICTELIVLKETFNFIIWQHFICTTIGQHYKRHYLAILMSQYFSFVPELKKKQIFLNSFI